VKFMYIYSERYPLFVTTRKVLHIIIYGCYH